MPVNVLVEEEMAPLLSDAIQVPPLRLCSYLLFAFSFYTHNVCTDHLRQRNAFGHWAPLH